jgi:hypothetical protein
MAFTVHETFYMLLGLATIAAVFWFNRELYKARLGVSALEGLYYFTALAALLVGWYFNIAYMREYQAEMGWWHWTTLLFVNPASASGGQDLIFANVILFPLWTIVDGRRRKMPHAWWYFPMSVFTSFAFAMALFLAVQERHLRRHPELR